jgi:hypothetical protein
VAEVPQYLKKLLCDPRLPLDRLIRIGVRPEHDGRRLVTWFGELALQQHGDIRLVGEPGLAAERPGDGSIALGGTRPAELAMVRLLNLPCGDRPIVAIKILIEIVRHRVRSPSKNRSRWYYSVGVRHTWE